MRIGINVLYLIPGEVGGTETYARNLLAAMQAELSQGDTLYVFCDREASKLFESGKQLVKVVLPFSARHRLTRIVYEQLILPLAALSCRLQVLFSLGYSQPLWLPCPSVVTIHDLNWYYHPEDFSPLSYHVWKWLTVWSARATTQVITDSAASAKSLRHVLKIPQSKVTPILHAAPEPLPISSDAIARTCQKYHLHEPFILTVLAGYPHKNLKTLLAAFARIRIRFPQLSLVICGLGGRADTESAARIRELHLEGVVHILGYIDRRELVALYHRAEIFVFPSAYEGFGYPVVEAMQYGTPVISSNAYSLSEVVGNGGVLVDPYDVDGYVTAIQKLLSSKTTRTRLISQGQARLATLSWQKTAQKTLHVIRRML